MDDECRQVQKASSPWHSNELFWKQHKGNFRSQPYRAHLGTSISGNPPRSEHRWKHVITCLKNHIQYATKSEAQEFHSLPISPRIPWIQGILSDFYSMKRRLVVHAEDISNLARWPDWCPAIYVKPSPIRYYHFSENTAMPPKKSGWMFCSSRVGSMEYVLQVRYSTGFIQQKERTKSIKCP